MLPFIEILRQKKRWWALVIFLLLLLICLLEEYGIWPKGGIVFPHLIVPGIITIVLLLLRLEVVVDDTGFSHRLFPVGKTIRRGWDEVARVELIRYIYKPSKQALFFKISDEYGYTFRMGASDGMLVTLKNGTKLFFGTKRPQELKQALIEFGQIK